MNFRIKLHNRFDILLTDAVTGEVKQTAKAENVVCDTYWEHLFSNVLNITYVQVGTGTGTPSRTDTQLFRRLSYKSVSLAMSSIDKNNWKATKTITLSENEWVGSLTEIGLSPTNGASSGDYIFTHAMFTDSEGHPITIIKTNADRLSVTITLYLTLTWTSPTNNVYFSPWCRNSTTVRQNADARVDYIRGDSLWTHLPNWLLHVAVNHYMFPNILPTSLPAVWPYSYPISHANSLGNIEPTYSLSTQTLRYTIGTRILSDSFNAAAPTTYLIKCLAIATEVFVTLPNESVYPAKQVTLETIADGTTTDFNFGIPELDIQGVEVYIDNVLQDSNTYTFYGRDYTHPQGWRSYDNLYVTKITGYDYPIVSSHSTTITGFHRPAPVCIWDKHIPYPYSTLTEFAEFYYDFQTNYTVSAVGVYKGTQNWRTYVGVPELYYSNDGESWTQLTNPWTDYHNQPNIDVTNGIVAISPISARYWKVKSYHNELDKYAEYTSTTNPGSFELVASILFDDPKPQLQFNTPPAANATVKIKAYCKYPIKNENWIIENGMTFDYTFTRQ